MNKIIKTFFVIISFNLAFICTSTIKAQAIEQGNVLIDGFYGWPNLFTMLVKMEADTTMGIGNHKISGMGPVGGRVEYLLSDKIGLGLDMSYGYTKIYLWSGSLYFQENINRFRILPRINIHFLNNNKLDFYFAAGVGYVSYTVKAKTNNPQFPTNGLENQSLFPPITARAAIGLRYFFNDKIGFNIEFGQLGPLATFGVSTKF